MRPRRQTYQNNQHSRQKLGTSKMILFNIFFKFSKYRKLTLKARILQSLIILVGQAMTRYSEKNMFIGAYVS